MSRIGADFEASGIEVDDLGLKRPSLDDVFLHLTGHRAEHEAAEDETGEVDEMEEALS
jgi:ABC-2 type transport system ATP-binding protein